jgi:hypothetical protein
MNCISFFVINFAMSALRSRLSLQLEITALGFVRLTPVRLKM